MTWIEIAKDHLAAAQMVVRKHPRCAASRAYYAAHCLIANALINAGYTLPTHRQTHSHQEQPGLVRRYLNSRRISTLATRLYTVRIDADYNRRATVDFRLGMEAIRDASEVFKLLRIQE